MFFICPKLEQTENNILCTGMMFKNYLSALMRVEHCLVLELISPKVL